MDDKKYEVIQLPFDKIGMSVRILKMDNKEDIESELSIFSKERGLIPKRRYEDYILSVYVINIGQLLYFINSNKDLISNFDIFREGLLIKLYKINPLLNPDGLIVNPFGLIKVDDTGTIGGYPFVENPSWNTDNNPAENALFDDKTADELVGSEDTPTEDRESEKTNKQKLDDHILKTTEAVKKIKHVYVKKWWDRLIMYVIIRKFETDNIKKIVLMGNYEDEPSYKSFIITSLIKDVESVFGLIDRFGLLTKFTPQQMVDELYELCIEVNPGADYKKLNKKINTASSSSKRVVQKTEYKALKDISSEKLLNLEGELNKLVVGQDAAINEVVRALKRSKIGIKDPACPIGSFLLAGKTGVGKTLLTKVLADELFKKEAEGGFIRIDCSEYSSDHEYSKLIGSPAGYVRSDEGGILTNAVLENPFSVVLFDEVEKASEKVHQLMLQIMDEGRLTDNHGEVVSFKDTLILMTSNIGATEVQGIGKTIGFGEVSKITNKRKNIVIEKAIKDMFKPEFLNRLTGTVYFNNVDKKSCFKIIELELDKLNNYLKNKHIFVNFSQAVKKLILEKGYSETYGAREIKRTVESVVSDSLADYIIENCIEKDTVINTKVKNKKVIYKHCNTITNFVSEKAVTKKCDNCKECCS
jgi:ATP-dependent Clp protease ATP-binding subunit ClpA